MIENGHLEPPRRDLMSPGFQRLVLQEGALRYSSELEKASSHQQARHIGPSRRLALQALDKEKELHKRWAQGFKRPLWRSVGSRRPWASTRATASWGKPSTKSCRWGLSTPLDAAGEAQLKLERMQQKAEQEQARLEAQKKAEKAQERAEKLRKKAEKAKKKAEAKLLKLKAKQEKWGSPMGSTELGWARQRVKEEEKVGI